MKSLQRVCLWAFMICAAALPALSADADGGDRLPVERVAAMKAAIDRYDALASPLPYAVAYAQRADFFPLYIELLTQPAEALAFFDGLFVRGVDPLFPSEGQDAPDGETEARLIVNRRIILHIITLLDAPGSMNYLQQAIDTLPAGQASEAVAFAVRLCTEVRPVLLRRVIDTDEPEGQSRFHGFQVLGMVQEFRLFDKVRPFTIEEHSVFSGSAINLPAAMNGQVEAMAHIAKTFTGAHNLNIAFDYLHRAGAYETLGPIARQRIDHILEHPDISLTFSLSASAARALARTDTPEAREWTMAYLRRDGLPPILRRGLLTGELSFFPPERMPMFNTLERDSDRWNIDRQLFELLGDAKDPFFKERAEIICSEHSGLPLIYARRWAELYLLRLGNEDARERLRSELRSTNRTRLQNALMLAIEAGAWDDLPGDYLERFNGSGIPKLAMRSFVEKHADPRALPFVRVLVSDDPLDLASLRLRVAVGDAEAFEPLRQRLARLLPNPRTEAAAVLYRAGDVSLFDELKSTMASDGIHGRVRVLATSALGATDPKSPLAHRAAQALLAALLDVDGRVSEAAHKALTELSGNAEVRFNPWEVDEVRRTQAEAWRAWADAVEAGG